MMHERYYVEAARQEELLGRKNRKTDFYNGIFDRYEYPVLTREHIPLTWRYDLNPRPIHILWSVLESTLS